MTTATVTQTTRPIEFDVAGIPKPQGSKRAFNRPGAKQPTMVESAGAALKDWRAAVKYAAAKQCRQIRGAVKVELAFRFPRPKSHFGTGRNADTMKGSAPDHHTKKPDLDKLERAVLDALTQVVIEDDSCVVVLSASKLYSSRVEFPGCHIRVEAA